MTNIIVDIPQATIDNHASKPEGNFNGLTPAQTERLVILQEELAEAIQAAAKVLRHGYSSDNRGKLALTNQQHLEEELGHVQNAITMLVLEADLSRSSIDVQQGIKARTIKQYLHHN